MSTADMPSWQCGNDDDDDDDDDDNSDDKIAVRASSKARYNRSSADPVLSYVLLLRTTETCFSLL